MGAANRRMLWHGMFLFLLGLLTGLLEERFKNMRRGLAAHLQGVMNGTFLLALGAIWANVQLPTRAKMVAYWTAHYGSYGNWLFTTLAAAFGTAPLSPITAGGPQGKALAGEPGEGWIPERRRFDHRFVRARSLGSSAEGVISRGGGGS